MKNTISTLTLAALAASAYLANASQVAPADGAPAVPVPTAHASIDPKPVRGESKQPLLGYLPREREERDPARVAYDAAVAAGRAGDRQKALRLMEAAVRLQPRVAEYHVGHGWALGLAGRWDEAIRPNAVSVELAKDSRHRRYYIANLAGAQIKSGYRRQAQRNLDWAHELGLREHWALRYRGPINGSK